MKTFFVKVAYNNRVRMFHDMVTGEPDVGEPLAVIYEGPDEQFAERLVKNVSSGRDSLPAMLSVYEESQGESLISHERYSKGGCWSFETTGFRLDEEFPFYELVRDAKAVAQHLSFEDVRSNYTSREIKHIRSLKSKVA